MKCKIISGIVEETRKRPFSESIPDEAVSTIFQAIGSASVCWSDVDNAGEFQAQRAHDIGLNLCNYIADMIDQERDDEAGYIESSGGPIETILLPIPRIVIKTLEGGK